MTDAEELEKLRAIRDSATHTLCVILESELREARARILTLEDALNAANERALRLGRPIDGHGRMSKPSIYLAAPFGTRADVEAIAALLRERGYAITSSWHAIGPDVVEPVGFGKVVAACNENWCCMSDADAFVLLAYPGGAEMWCELSVWCTWHGREECGKPIIVDFGHHMALTAKRFGLVVKPADRSINAVSDAIDDVLTASG